ncbi:MAG TPA: hypothetical protein HPP87_03565 [Planctomycetes bacterium]|nr:hypothetical protein [Planctomycetota bacterium]
MKFSFFSLFAIALLPTLVVSVCKGQAPSEDSVVTLVVKVNNGTAQGKSVTGDPVFVEIHQHEKLTATFEGRVDSTGQAVLENVPATEHTVAVPFASHSNMMYTGFPVRLTPDKDTHIAKVMVYDISGDNSKLSVGMHHFIIRAETDSLLITEYMQLNNPTDKAIISQERDARDLPVVFKISLPPGFGNLRFLSYFQSPAVVVTKDGFYDTMATPPGDNQQAAFSYTLDVDSETMKISKKISLPTSEFAIFSQLGAGKISGLGPAKGSRAMSDGTSAEYFAFSGLNSGDTINFQVTGFNVIKSQRDLWIIIGAVFAVAAAGAVVRASLKKKQTSVE